MTSNYLVIFERADDGTVSAYAPELQPGAVVTTGSSYEEARTKIAEAIALWLDEMRTAGRPLPSSPIRYELLEIAS